jgi:hypothetical protein
MSRSASFVYAGVAVIALLVAACDGEDRPRVDVIGDGEGSVSVSASASGPGASGMLPGSGYTPVSNVDIYFQMSLDLRDIRTIMAAAATGQPVDWAAARAIYENGKNQVQASGSPRSLASIPNEAVQAVFPNGAAVYGRPDFINALVRDGLNGIGRAQGASDATRRQIVDKGIQMLFYGKALQEMDSARARVAQGNTDNATGAPHAVDEAWAVVAGLPDSSMELSQSLLATAIGRESNFGLQGKIRLPIETAFLDAQRAAQQGDLAAFDRAHAEVKGNLNAVFYLGALRYLKPLEAARTPTEREVQFAEGGAFWQTIRAVVAAASPSAAQTVEAAYSRSPNDEFPAATTTAVYAALNEPAVLQALGIPAPLVVRTPPQ